MLPTHSFSQSSLHWEEARSRSLPRHLGRRRREEELEEQERCLTDRLRRRADYMDRDRADLIDRSIQLLIEVAPSFCALTIDAGSHTFHFQNK